LMAGLPPASAPRVTWVSARPPRRLRDARAIRRASASRRSDDNRGLGRLQMAPLLGRVGGVTRRGKVLPATPKYFVAGQARWNPRPPGRFRPDEAHDKAGTGKRFCSGCGPRARLRGRIGEASHRPVWREQALFPWRIGVLECWSIGVVGFGAELHTPSLNSPSLRLSSCLIHSTISLAMSSGDCPSDFGFRQLFSGARRSRNFKPSPASFTGLAFAARAFTVRMFTMAHLRIVLWFPADCPWPSRAGGRWPAHFEIGGLPPSDALQNSANHRRRIFSSSTPWNGR